MTELLDEIEARCKAATKGPWIFDENYNYWLKNSGLGEIIISAFDRNHNSMSLDVKESDIEFIANSKQDVERLCKALRVMHTYLYFGGIADYKRAMYEVTAVLKGE